MSPSSMGKRNREQAKREKAEAKRQRRLAAVDRPADDEAPDGSDGPGGEPAMSTDDLLRRIEEVHRLHDDGQMSDDEFQETKADLLGRLQVD